MTHTHHTPMAETIKAKAPKTSAKLQEASNRNPRPQKKGAIKAALKDATKRFTTTAKVDQKSLKGCIKPESTSIELQQS